MNSYYKLIILTLISGFMTLFSQILRFWDLSKSRESKYKVRILNFRLMRKLKLWEFWDSKNVINLRIMSEFWIFLPSSDFILKILNKICHNVKIKLRIATFSLNFSDYSQNNEKKSDNEVKNSDCNLNFEFNLKIPRKKCQNSNFFSFKILTSDRTLRKKLKFESWGKICNFNIWVTAFLPLILRFKLEL